MKNFIKNNSYIFIIFIFSALLFLLTGTITILMLLNTQENSARSAFCLGILYSLSCITAIFIFNILFIYIKNKWQKWRILINIFLAILNTIILGQQLTILILIMLISYIDIYPNWYDEYKPITDTTMYIEAKNKIGNIRETKHFPVNVPNKAQNIGLYEYYWTFKDYSAILLLKFDIDNNYIENEIKKNKCRNLIAPDINNSEYNKLKTELIRIDDNKYYKPLNYTFCILNPNNTPESRFKTNYGIAFKNNQIVYYYSKKNW